jgi:hypothetical protein
VRKLALLLVSTAGLIVMGSSAMAEDPAQPAPAATAAPAAAPAAAPSEDGNKLVCRNMAAATGTRLGARRECKTQREWDDARLQTQKEIGQMQSQGNLGPRGN